MRNKDVQYFRARVAPEITWAFYRKEWYHCRGGTYRRVSGTGDPVPESDQRFTELYARLKNFYFDPKVIF